MDNTNLLGSGSGKVVVLSKEMPQSPSGRFFSDRGSSGGGGNPTMAPETKDYIDAKIESVAAQNSASFAQVMARLDVLQADIDSKPTPPSIWQIAGVVATGIVSIVAILAFASDRFDGGIAASGVVRQAISEIERTQVERDERQDERLDQIINALQHLSVSSDGEQSNE